MGMDMETLQAAERAADWLVRLETATPQQLAEFWQWLTESPLHVQEMLAAQACHVELTKLLKNGRISPSKLMLSDELSTEAGSEEEEPPHVLRNALLEALQILAASPRPAPAVD
ncbi:hypothetical protein GCM10011487_70370 [Steroidobacter agaridevorans]|uniref:FecR N-terminal domain-containing protein n=1 Tax=Steroidobacter agaridevorans TaxID=2695856 RepID=A0A829YNW0_9GAMM|nr:FecR/PupR family sigma factor regulator [Steroidobacter agaridevorans]GFE85037.1 hypothetical protein GCM10011487_70370 [Steroidobacter agaridevorans]GFE90810.1 hypothetical protein GCM10011488_57640 [Steroidobacter agaridevorans]